MIGVSSEIESRKINGLARGSSKVFTQVWQEEITCQYIILWDGMITHTYFLHSKWR